MEPPYSYNNPETPIFQLREILSQVVLFPTGNQKKEVNANIQNLCQKILQNSENIPYVDRFFLMRSMHDFAKSGIEGYKKGKAALRECFKVVILGMCADKAPHLDPKMTELCMQSYPEYQFYLPVLNFFFPLLQKNQTVPQEVFFNLIQLCKLEESILKQLYEMLSKSGSACREYLHLIGRSLFELELDPQLGDLGLYHRHLEWATEEDTLGSEDDTHIENSKKSDLNKILNILSNEIDGGYFLLKQAEFLTLSREELYQCILAIKDNSPKPEINDRYHSPLTSYFNIEPKDRPEAIKIAMHLSDQLQYDFSNKTALRCHALEEMNVIPEEMWQKVCEVIPNYQIYEKYNSLLNGMNRGFIVAYLLLPYMQELKATPVNFLLCDSLVQKLNDPQLPLKTRSGLARLVLEKKENLGIQENSPLYQTAKSIWEEGKNMTILAETLQTMDFS